LWALFSDKTFYEGHKKGKKPHNFGVAQKVYEFVRISTIYSDRKNTSQHLPHKVFLFFNTNTALFNFEIDFAVIEHLKNFKTKTKLFMTD